MQMAGFLVRVSHCLRRSPGKGSSRGGAPGGLVPAAHAVVCLPDDQHASGE